MTPLEATALIPGAIAALVGVAEARSSAPRVNKVRSFVFVILALVLVLVFFALERVIDLNAPYMPWIARGMTVLSAMVALSGALIKYSRKSNAVLMTFVGLMLAYYWAFLSQLRP
jgi:predicted membrane channel-forming protein YqfA (hemolysin III family)